ncbi:hypothetical protein FQN54_004075 [Arachnomyces sp. PD_36]|nr:hypothetical protein FQN54_004075 [Arachnomyces sp. PD_36]
MLLDPKAYSKQLALGNTLSSSPSSLPPPELAADETPLLRSDKSASVPPPGSDGDNNAYSSNEGRRGPNSPGSRISQQNGANKPTSDFSPAGTAFDPRLLSPRSFSSKPSRSANSTPTGRSDNLVSDETQRKRDYEDHGSAGQGSLIENMYGVQMRANQPLKKRKVDGEVSTRSTPNFSTSGNAGMGEYMKEEREKGETKELPLRSSVIDLTLDKEEDKPTAKDDDDVIFIADKDVGSQEVCFGKLDGATILAHRVPKPASRAFGLGATDWPSIRCQLRRERGKDTKIDAVDPSGNVFGAVDQNISAALAPLMDSPAVIVRVQARLDVRKRKADEWPGQPCSEVYRVTLNLYGPRQRADAIGRYLSQKNIWLGTPNSVDAGISTYNPHAEKRATRPGYGPPAGVGVGPRITGPHEVRTAEEVNNAILKVFDQLTSTENLPEMETPSLVATPLLRHQKQALWFMTEKEKPRKFGPKDEDNNSLWRICHQQNGRKYFREIVTGTTLYQEPPQVLGGLLADMMGLGKTLSILSLIAESHPTSLEWEKQAPPNNLRASTPVTRNAKTTLLVSPLSAVNNWTEQIKEHLKENSLSYNVFHGNARTTDADELAKYDIVITTYSTVLSEVLGKGAKKGVSPLMKLNLFRIVLDEAHTIREQNTAQSQAIFQLQADRRWSVTGTPIQNRLDDLGSVTRFLKLFPFDDRGRFSIHVLNPFKNEDISVLATLRVLVDSFTLRRVKDRINLPPRQDKVVTLEFSEDEKSLYEFFKNESNVMMNVIAGQSKSRMAGRMYHHVLKAMMQLRRICAHGKELLDPEERERMKGLTADDAIDLEGESNRAALTEKKTYEMFALMKENSVEECVKCGRGFEEKRTDSGAVDKTAPIAVMLPCCDVLCMDCFKPLQATFDQVVEIGKPLKCLFCEGTIPASYSHITPAGFEKYQESLASDKLTKKKAKSDGVYEKPHSKTKALIGYLWKSAEISNQNPNEPPIKSVVFSSWTSHLDLIEIALTDRGMDGFTRLDGSMTLKNRHKALDTFRDDPSVTILLITLGAGGVGLNLTAASNVYIMEPQYNPAAVAQAVDRIHRIGQKREVTTIQFIMKDSIEERIAELAKKKQQLADLSMNRGKVDKREVQQSRMKEYRSLFK